MKKNLRRIFGSLCLAALSQLSASAQMSGWTYRQEITINHSLSTAEANVPVLIKVNTQNLISSAKLKADAGDLRFTAENGNVLHHWVESGLNDTNTKVWIKVPQLDPATSAKVIMYYGNQAAASTSKGDSVFVFFEDYGSTKLDSSKWAYYKETTVTDEFANGKLTLKGNGFAVMTSRNLGITAPFNVHTNVNGYSAYSWDLGAVGVAREDQKFMRINFFSGVASRYGTGFTALGSPGSIYSTTPITTTSCDTLYDFISTIDSYGAFQISTPKGLINIPEDPYQSVSNATRISLSYLYNSANAQGYCTGGRQYNHVFVTKIEPQVNVSFSNEIVDHTGVKENSSVSQFVTVWPNPASDEITIDARNMVVKNIVLSDISGRVIMTAEAKNIMNVQSLSKGIYLLTIETDRGTISKKLIRE